jgi:hypothetical protein
LDGKNRQGRVPQTLNGPVIQVDVGYLKFRRTRDFAFTSLDRKAVVLCCDENPAASAITDRMISPAMAIRQFGGPPPEGERQELVPQADTEGR